MIHDLTGAWAVKQAHSTDALGEAQAAGEWYDAVVPGCVHLDLMKAGKIPDPFYGFNERDVQWVADADWLYRRPFKCPAALREMKRMDLVCKGLDTFAEVFLNGERVGRADNMFLEWRWDVTKLLKDGANELLVLFESPRKVGNARMAEDESSPVSSSWMASAQRVYTRKAQYASGWDWGPDLNTSGIWRSVFLEGCNKGRVSDVWTQVDWRDPDAPVVNVSVEIEAVAPCPAEVKAELSDGASPVTASAEARLSAGTNVVELAIPVEGPQLWWPAGSGPQNLYELRVTGVLDGEELPPATVNVGLRKIELRREKDEQGESFVFCVNGEPVFCKGADWVPGDSFLPRLTQEDYGDLIQTAADANMNMLRVWGGGLYENDDFYDVCDRLGILVWQDFMFACAPYPDHLDWFCSSVEAEARYNVRRLRNHPCIAIWCGNNENQMIYQSDGTLAGNKLYQETLPGICAELDPSRPYWPGSPFGGEDPNSPNEGNQHCWITWHGWAHPDVLRNYDGRFITEFGMQAPPPLETIREYVPSHGHSMLSPAMEHHERDTEGTERLYRYLSAMFRAPADFGDTIYLMQLTQAEAVKGGVEHWRSRKFRTGGSMFWQFNDCWPVTSWSCLDYARRPKALYYYARRFYSPVLPVVDHRDGQFSVTVVNDRPEDFNGQLICGFGSLSGDQDWVHKCRASVAANSASVVQTKPDEELDMAKAEDRYFWCRLMEGGHEIARNAWFLIPYKHVDFKAPEWDVEVEKTGRREFLVRLASDTFAKGAWLQVEGAEAKFSDNFMDVLPEVAVRIAVTTTTDLEAAELERRLRIRSVADTLPQ